MHAQDENRLVRKLQVGFFFNLFRKRKHSVKATTCFNPLCEACSFSTGSEYFAYTFADGFQSSLRGRFFFNKWAVMMLAPLPVSILSARHVLFQRQKTGSTSLFITVSILSARRGLFQRDRDMLCGVSLIRVSILSARHGLFQFLRVRGRRLANSKFQSSLRGMVFFNQDAPTFFAKTAVNPFQSSQRGRFFFNSNLTTSVENTSLFQSSLRGMFFFNIRG